MANPFPFVAGQVLTAAELNGIGEAGTAFTPTYTGYTRGNGTVFAKFMRVNQFVFVYVQEILGSTSSMTASPVMDLPVASNGAASQLKSGVEFYDDSANIIYFGQTRSSGGTTVEINAQLASGTYVSRAQPSATVPFTWATGDRFTFAICYEAA